MALAFLRHRWQRRGDMPVNPTMNTRTFSELPLVRGQSVMTVQGTVNKTIVLLLLTSGAAAYTWRMAMENPQAAGMWTAVGAIGGFIVALITVFKKQWAPMTAPVYAILEGLLLGAISALFEKKMPGIAFQAVMLTFGTLAAMLAAYTTGVIRATPAFKRGVIAATGGICIFYLVSMVLGFFGIHFQAINGGGMIGIGFSLVVVVIAAMNLVIDFDLIESGAQAGAPKYMEWYAGFSLLVTLVWLYLEILRLLSKLNRRN